MKAWFCLQRLQALTSIESARTCSRRRAKPSSKGKRAYISTCHALSSRRRSLKVACAGKSCRHSMTSSVFAVIGVNKGVKILDARGVWTGLNQPSTLSPQCYAIGRPVIGANACTANVSQPIYSLVTCGPRFPGSKLACKTPCLHAEEKFASVNPRT